MNIIILIAILVVAFLIYRRYRDESLLGMIFKVAIKALSNNKARSFLSMLGIIIGVAAVIVMMSIGQGSKEAVRKNISQMGTNIIMIRPGADRRGGVRMDPSSMQTLKQEDYEAIRNECKYVKYISPEVQSGGQAIYGSNNYNTTAYGESLEYMDIKQWEIEDGTCFTEQDVQTAAKVCIIGKTLVDNLFPDGQSPVGKTIRFKSTPVRVIGVLKSKGYNSFGMDQDNLMIMPYTAVMKRLLAQTYFQTINVSSLTEETTDQTIEELTEVLRRSHKLKDDAEDDFTIHSQAEMMETMSSTMDSITIILVVAAAFSLLVAGIGIMNIMLVSVTERTKEIGLRMSVGARSIDISVQFLIESILISITGGLLGVLLGYGISALATSLFGLPTSVPFWSVILSFVVCTIIGIVFGYIPAQKAANLDPIEAIRYE